MLIRTGGYNTGAQEYLEKGTKAGREFTRDELDHRLILDGNLDLTRSIYESIPDHGQDRYLTFTMSFKEDVVPEQTLREVTQEFKQFIMQAYKRNEYNFYAEAHIPKLKMIADKATGEMITRKPHIHVIIPRINLFSGNEANPVGKYLEHEKYFEAFQEYINQKYNLASPRENIRVDINDSAKVLARYKGDDFYGKNREFKQNLVKTVIERDVRSRSDFYSLVSEFGDTKIRNLGKETEYIAVKLPGDAKYTNLKETIFQDPFILSRELKKEPLDPALINERLMQWPQRSREIKYVHKATPSFRKRYSSSNEAERSALLAAREIKFYQLYGEDHDRLYPVKRPSDHERGPAEAAAGDIAELTDSLQNLPGSEMANHGQSGSAGISNGSLLLPNDAHVHLGQSQPGGDLGLRSPLPGGRGGGTGQRQETSAEQGHQRRGSSTVSPEQGGAATSRPKRTTGQRSRQLDHERLPGAFMNPNRVPSVEDIQARGSRLFDPLKQPGSDGLKILLRDTSDFIDAPDSANSRAARPSRGRGRKATPQSLPGSFLDPRRVPSVEDIQTRSSRLFDPLKRKSGGGLTILLRDAVPPSNQSTSQSKGGPTTGGDLTQTKSRGLRGANPRSSTALKSLPPYARNPHRVPTINDIQAHGQRLFGPLKNTVSSPLSIKLASVKALTVNRSASSVAAQFSRQAEQNQLLPAQRHALRRVNQQYFDLRRALFSDQRLTRQDKAQLVSVLSFERLKASELIKKTSIHTEVHFMGSAEIRQLITDDKEDPGFSISSPAGLARSGIRTRVKRIMDRFSRQIDPEQSQERTRDLAAKDLYTRKSKFSQNVHYISKTTDKTLFVDTGTAIAMRRTGITESGVAVALQLAKERFGSTLTINGTAEFKQLVINAAAANGLDIHFTDKKMNDALALRRAELDINADAEHIQSPGAEASKAVSDAEEPTAASPAAATAAAVAPTTAPASNDRSIIVGELLAHGPAPYLDDQKNGPSYFVTLSTATGPRTLWSVTLEEAMAQHAFNQGDQVRLKDLGEQPVTVHKAQADGTFAEVSALRRVWEAEPASLDQSVQTSPADPASAEPTIVVQPQPEAVASRVDADEQSEAAAASSSPAESRAVPTVPSWWEASVLGDWDQARFEKYFDNQMQEQPERTSLLSDDDVFAAYMASEVFADAGPLKPQEQQSETAIVDDSGSSELVRRELEWRSRMAVGNSPGLSEAEVLSANTVMGLRGEDHAMWLVATNDHTPACISMVSKYLEHDEYREKFKSTIEMLYEQAQDSPETIASIDEAIDFVVPIVSAVESAKRTELENNVVSPAIGTIDTAPAQLNFVHNGQPASLGLSQVPAVEAAPAQAVTIEVNGESLLVDPTNDVDVAKYSRQLQAEVLHQSEEISGATKLISLNTNMRDNYSADRGPEFVEECNSAIAAGERTLQSATGRLEQAQASLLQITTAVAAIVQVEPVRPDHLPSVDVHEKAAPQPLNFVHNGEPASLGLPPVAATTAPPVPEAVTINFNGESVTVDPSNAVDMARYVRQLQAEVVHQTQEVNGATKLISLNTNMRDNYSADRGPEFVEECNSAIAAGERTLRSATERLDQAQASLGQLSSIQPAAAQAAPVMPSFTYEGQTASLGLTSVPSAEDDEPGLDMG